LDAENGGLVAALRQFLERFKVPSGGPQVHLQTEYPERLSHNVELTIFAIVQEAVNNAIKHANASNCWIEIRQFGDRLLATVRDDGNGFDVKQLQDEYENRGSWGLLNMAERAQLIDAKLNISSQPSRGTLVSLDLSR
jgi:signal transduction histidine kinase